MTATNSTEPAKDGTGAAFNITFAAESVSGNKAQKTYIGEPSGETIITPAQDGTDGTGITPPTGAVGIRGWLSGIYSRLAGPISVTGTFWPATQPISAASLPLPSGAAQDGTDATGITQLAGGVGIRGWLSGIFSKLSSIIAALGTPMQATGGTVGLVAGSAAIGSIIGRTTMATVTPTVTSNGAYLAGNEIGGLMSFAIGGAGSGTLMSVRVTSRSVLSTALKAYIFTSNPSNSTWTDKLATAINAADIASLLGVITLNTADSGLGTHTIWNVGAIGEQFVAANLYVVLVAVSAANLTSASVSDITVQLGILDD